MPLKVGVIVPTLGKRPALLDRAKFYIGRQTVQPAETIIVDYPQKRKPYDLTERYRFGIERVKGSVDVMFFMEDDDYYPPHYIETMLKLYEDAGIPQAFGIGETYFYHPELRRVWHRSHPAAGPCAFQMMIRSDAVKEIDWSLVNDLFIDAGLWRQLHGQVAYWHRSSPYIMALGMKHGRGPCAAGGHTPSLYNDAEKRDDEETWADPDFSWLRSKIGLHDASWYETFASNRSIV